MQLGDFYKMTDLARIGEKQVYYKVVYFWNIKAILTDWREQKHINENNKNLETFNRIVRGYLPNEKIERMRRSMIDWWPEN